VNDWEQDVLPAKEDEQRLAELIERSRAFILRCASETAHRYITESDDEWSAALLGFTEAVREYEGGKGSFRAFAAIVIRRRVLDQLRAEGRHAGEVSVAPEAFEDGLDEETASGLETQVQRRMTEEAGLAADDTAARTRDEIDAVQTLLAGYGFSFFDLADCSPRTDKTRRACARAVRALLRNETLLSALRGTKTLPMKELCAASGVTRKLLDRHRRYVIAAAEILAGDYPILSGYMDFIRKAEA